MPAEEANRVRTFVLLPEQDLAHAIARKLQEDPSLQVIGISTNPDDDAYRIFHEDPDVIVADVDAGGLQFLTEERLPPGKHRVVFFAPKSKAGCNACYEALTSGAHAIHCRPASAEELGRCGELLQSIKELTPLRSEDCPAVKRVQREQDAAR